MKDSIINTKARNIATTQVLPFQVQLIQEALAHLDSPGRFLEFFEPQASNITTMFIPAMVVVVMVVVEDQH